MKKKCIMRNMKQTILMIALSLGLNAMAQSSSSHDDCPLTAVVNDSQIILTYDTTFDLSDIDNVNINVGKKKYNDMPLDSLVGQTLYFENTKGLTDTKDATKIDIRDGRSTIYHCHEDIPLPVTWLGVGATTKGKEIVVEWSTAMELNNSHFVIEKYFAHGWDSIGSMKGRGSTFKTTLYSFWDSSPIEGLNVYRVKQIDYDGEFEYSEAFKAKWHESRDEYFRPFRVYNIIGQKVN